MRSFLAAYIVLFLTSMTAAQSGHPFLLFEWDNVIYAQPLGNGEVIRVGDSRDEFDAVLNLYDVYNLDASPLLDKPDGNFGFHHGVWSQNQTQFAYLLLSPPSYQVRLLTDTGDNLLIIDNIVSETLAYLDPVDWMDDQTLLLLERVAFRHLHQVRLYTYDFEARTLDLRTEVITGQLVGRTAMMNSGLTLFLGFDVPQNRGVVLDTVSGQIENFAINFTSFLPPQKGFEYYPLAVYGVVTRDELLTLAQTLPTLPATVQEQPLPEPFLHWSLADHRRYITCYTDSEWTAINFETTCPGLAGRNYEGHQGTDVSDEPDGLRIGTPVYPSAMGVIVASYRNCTGTNPSCNNSYGNTVTMEHVRIVDGKTQIWYTGYGHLQMAIPDDGTLITDLTQPIALSGATGVGGAHLHFEVRAPDGWIDPWQDKLWVLENDQPLALVKQEDLSIVPKVLDVCVGYAGNNIRNGAGTTFAAIGKTLDRATYYVTNIAYVSEGDAIGDWYEVLFAGGQGWLWAETLSCP